MYIYLYIYTYCFFLRSLRASINSTDYSHGTKEVLHLTGIGFTCHSSDLDALFHPFGGEAPRRAVGGAISLSY